MRRFHAPSPARALPALLVVVSSFWLEACKGCRDDPDTIVPNETPPEDPHDIGQYLSMRTMPDGSPAMAYYDRTKGGLSFRVGTMKGEDMTWAEERIDGFADANGLDSGDRGKYASLAIDSAGTAWITYYDAINGALLYARRDAANSYTKGIADVGGGVTPNAGLFSSLQLDASNNPVVAHYDRYKGQLRIAHWKDTSFVGEVVDEGTDYIPPDGSEEEPKEADVGSFARLLIHDGVEYIAYYDAANGDLKLASGTAGNYVTVVVDSEGDVGKWPSMVHTGSELMIAYQDSANQDLKLARGSGTNWSIETIDSGDFRGADSEIFLNGSFPSILYFDGNENNLLLARNDGSSWSVDTLGGADAALGFHNETVSTGGKRYIACYDYTNRTIWFQELL